MEPVTLAFSSNDNHAMLLGVALCSIFENKKGDYPTQVFVMDGGISKKNKQRMQVLEKRYSFKIKYIVPDIKLFSGIPTDARPIPAYYRIAIGRMLPADCHKALYMDCDVVVKGDIGELFAIDLGDKTVAAVADQPQDFWVPRLKKMCGELGMLSDVAMEQYRGLSDEALFRYFNSGVMLINLDRWRARDIERQLFEFIRKNPDKLWVADQDPLNIILFRDWQELPVKYNFLPPPTRISEEKHPVIIHFAAGDKPWYLFSALGYQRDYVYYANKTPWRRVKYRKLMDIHFAKKHGVYPVAWGIWKAYKNTKQWLVSPFK
jgi:lipopolysaccharide biosynthesis glycosyltransferase